MRGWYVAKSKAHKEDWLEIGLKQYGVEVYIPRIVTRRRGKKTTEPLFPTYLFCKLDPDDPDWPSVYRTPGLNLFLGSAEGQPTEVPEDVVSFVKQRVHIWNGGGYSPKHLDTGDSIRVANGPYAGFEGVFKKYLPSKQRCQILLNAVGGFTTVTLSEHDLAISMPST